MTRIEVRRSRNDKKPVEVEFDFGVSTSDAARLFNSPGPYGDVVHYLFVQAAKQQLSEAVRGMLEDGLKPAEIIDNVALWKPSIKHRGTPPLERARKVVGGLSAEERDALLAELNGGEAVAK